MALFGNIPQGYWQDNEFIMPEVEMPQYALPQQQAAAAPMQPSLISGPAGFQGRDRGGEGRRFTPRTNARNYLAGDDQPYAGGGYSTSLSGQEAGRGIAGLLGLPDQTSAYGITEIPQWAGLASGIFPGGTAATAGLRGLNISNIQDVQGSLDVPEEDQTSMWNVLNPFSDVARGDPRARIADVKTGGRDYGVSFGGLLKKAYDKGGVKADFTTGVTPKEALLRKAYAEKPPKPKRKEERERTPGGAQGRREARSRGYSGRAR